ncbi:MAG: hypothetical protein ABIF77_00060 [bacterium]
MKISITLVVAILVITWFAGWIGFFYYKTKWEDEQAICRGAISGALLPAPDSDHASRVRAATEEMIEVYDDDLRRMTDRGSDGGEDG